MKVICAWCHPGIDEDPVTGEKYSHGICKEHAARLKEQIVQLRSLSKPEVQALLCEKLALERN